MTTRPIAGLRARLEFALKWGHDADAIRAFDEIAASHAALLAACEAVLAGFRYEKGRPVMAEWKMKEILAAAVALARGD